MNSKLIDEIWDEILIKQEPDFIVRSRIYAIDKKTAKEMIKLAILKGIEIKNKSL